MEWNVQVVKELTDGIFRKLLGLILVVGGGIFLWKTAFLEEGKYTGEIVGFVMGTALTTVIGFYFHTSQGSVDKAKQLDKVIPNLNGKEEDDVETTE